ncbi:MAG: type IV conjugative transfer system protein TraL [Sphingomonadales bacterium]
MTIKSCTRAPGPKENLGLYAIYWFFPNVFNFRATPPSAIRRYV